jgi:hypothetical protein
MCAKSRAIKLPLVLDPCATGLGRTDIARAGPNGWASRATGAAKASVMLTHFICEIFPKL